MIFVSFVVCSIVMYVSIKARYIFMFQVILCCLFTNLHFRHIFSCGTDASLSCHVFLNGGLTLDHTVPKENEMLSLALNAQVQILFMSAP